MGKLQNNLFNYATSELSQDAFICWLLSHAMKEFETQDAELTKCAKDFLRQFTNNTVADPIVVDIKKQYNNIDVLVILENNIAIIIEDKTFTSEHSNQINRYSNIIKNDKDFKHHKLYCVYFKTWFDSCIYKIKADCICDRLTILNTLEKYHSQNAIFAAFKQRQQFIDKDAKTFMDKDTKSWGDAAICGFFDWLQNSDESPLKEYNIDYDYVNNPNGGFYGCWFFWEAVPEPDNQFCTYVQLNRKWNEDCTISLRAGLGKRGTYAFKDVLLDSLQGTKFTKPRVVKFVNCDSASFAEYEEVITNFEQAKEILPKVLEEYRQILDRIKNHYK